MELIITYRFKIFAVLLLLWAGMNFWVFPPAWFWVAIVCMVLVLGISIKLFKAKP
ncbi:hypothetical protein [Myroides sp. WP-1]|uniref:hypothetical protein n=1 Tax=Myroides sp. WP-1 TaxID=2759944 RepID=UPI0015FE2E1A|nr:hypothetical protein [Myroides sp. WP-1]MBB1140390.1 hypothetical protein [Myroides sp. WP-1]